MAKKKKVEKVAKETGVEPRQLARLPQEALDKLDELVPDEDLIGSDEPEVEAEPEVVVEEVDVEVLNAQAAELAAQEEESESEEEEIPVVEPEPTGVCVGWHPITKKKVYK